MGGTFLNFDVILITAENIIYADNKPDSHIRDLLAFSPGLICQILNAIR